MERPLTSYYLLLGGSTMLLAIGLMMVLSASSVYSYRMHDNSYYIFFKQLTWVLIGLPAAWLASRMNRRVLRYLAWPAVLVAVVLLRAHPDRARVRGQRQPQLAGARSADAAALRDRQALDHRLVPPTSTPRRRSCSATRGTRCSRSPRWSA